MNNIITQGIGFIGLIMVIYIFQFNNRKKLLSSMIIPGLFFIVHFILLGAFTGAIMNILNIFRNYVFSQKYSKKWANNNYWLYLFTVIYVIAGILTWEGYYTLLPIFAMILENNVFWLKKEKTIRILSILPRFAWFIYSYIVGSFVGMSTETFILGSILIAIYRYDYKSKND